MYSHSRAYVKFKLHTLAIVAYSTKTGEETEGKDSEEIHRWKRGRAEETRSEIEKTKTRLERHRWRVRMGEIEGQESAGKMKVKRHTGTTQGREK